MAAPDVLAIADALALRYASGTLTPPAGYAAVRQSTARIPNAINLVPFVVVTLPEGEIVMGGGESEITYEFHVLFHYGKHAADVARDMKGMLDWLGPLLWATTGQTSLGLTATQAVKSALPSAFRLVVATYAGQEFYGWDITVPVITRPVIAFTP